MSSLRPLLCAFLCAAFLPCVAGAEPVREAIDLGERAQRDAAGSQARIDSLDDETKALEARYSHALQRVDSLTRYHEQLDRLVTAQQTERDLLEQELEQASDVEREVLPLIGRMVESLERFVALDMPFLEEERRTRLERLRALVDRPDVDLSEKYARVLEAHQIENEYGRTLEARRDTIRIDGTERTVDLVRIGRVAWLYRTPDGREHGRWDPSSRSWTRLMDRHGTAIREALRIARKQSAPALIHLPIETGRGAP